MSKVPFMPLWVADFMAKTSDLDAKEAGAYLLILMTLWTRGGVLSADQKKLQRVARVGRDWPKVWDAISHYFTVENGQISQGRLTEELHKANMKREVNAQAGARGGRAKALKTNEQTLANASDPLKQSEPESEVEETTANAVVAHKPPEQPKRAGSPKSGARGSRIPANWTPTPKDYAFAASEGMTREEINREADRFRDYWTAASGRTACKLDWEATWRNWLRSDYRKPSARAVAATVNAPRGAFDRVVSRVDAGASGGDIPERTDLRAFDAGAIDGEFRVVSSGDVSGSDWSGSGSDQADAGSLFGQRRAGHGS